VANSTRGGHGARTAPASAPTTYGDFVATHTLLFIEARQPLEANHWLRVIESTFGSDATAWWANFAATHPVDYQLLWTEFRSTFHAHHIPASMMR
jgi:hypothetical protein